MPEFKAAEDGNNRTRLLELLCAGERTTSELAEEIGISANGTRGHLDRLEAEGLIAHRVVRRGVGKPAHLYRLTAEGSLRTSRAYLPLLSALLTAADESPTTEGAEELLRRAGRALARGRQRAEGTLRERAEAAAALLAELGGTAEVREEGELLWIEGGCCPLRALVLRHSITCAAVEALLSDVVRATVREHCQKDEAPSCRFSVAAGPLPPAA